MTNQELFSQAIADAKAVRDAAVANAKAALEETFTPRIMDMLSAKLNEMEEDLEERVQGSKENIKAGVKVHPHGQPERVMTVVSPDGGFNGKVQVEDEKGNKASFDAEDLDLVETQEEGHEATIGYGAAMQKPTIEGEMEEGDSMEETDLEEILAQLEAEEKGKQEEGKDEVEEGKKDMEEAKKEVEEGKKEVEEAKKKDNDKKKVEESLEEADDDDEMTELTVDELKDIIRDVLKDVLAGSEEEEGEGDIDLGDEAGAEAGEEEEVEDEESISLDELLAELDKEEEGKKPVEEKKEVEEAKKEVEESKKEVEEAKKDLEEAIKTIKTLHSELNEVNLLNAKLLYTNKIFKAKSLNEAQKVKVLKAFDKATNVKDVKTVYNTLSESLTIRTKSTIKESVGFASKAAGVAPKQPIVEGDAAIRRMQQLAGIIK